MAAVIAATVALGLGMGNIMAPATDSIMGSLPRAKAGVGSAVNDTTRQTGGAIGVAVLGIQIPRASALRDGVRLHGHVPARVVSAAGNSIGGSLAVAAKSGGALGATVADAARQSFVSGMHLASLVAAVILLSATFGVWRWLPARASEVDPNAAYEPEIDLDAETAEPAVERV